MRRIEELKPKIKWGDELEDALKTLQNELTGVIKMLISLYKTLRYW